MPACAGVCGRECALSACARAGMCIHRSDHGRGLSMRWGSDRMDDELPLCSCDAKYIHSLIKCETPIRLHRMDLAALSDAQVFLKFIANDQTNMIGISPLRCMDAIFVFGHRDDDELRA